jgi:hypothetical protein
MVRRWVDCARIGAPRPQCNLREEGKDLQAGRTARWFGSAQLDPA